MTEDQRAQHAGTIVMQLADYFLAHHIEPQDATPIMLEVVRITVKVAKGMQ